jgi:hypothetical protein
MNVVADKGFTEKIFSADKSTATPVDFFRHFFWSNIAAKSAIILQNKTAS